MSESIQELNQILKIKDTIIEQLIQQVQMQEKQLKSIFEKLPAQDFHFYSIEGLVYQHFLVKHEGKMYLTLEIDEGDMSGDLLVDCRCKAIRRGCLDEIKQIQRSNQQLRSQFEKLKNTISSLLLEKQNRKGEKFFKRKSKSFIGSDSHLNESHEAQTPEELIHPLLKMNSDQDSMSISVRKKSLENSHNAYEIEDNFIRNEPTNSELFRIDEPDRLNLLDNNLREKGSYHDEDDEYYVQKPKRPIDLSAELKKHQQQLSLKQRKKLVVRRGYQ